MKTANTALGENGHVGARPGLKGSLCCSFALHPPCWSSCHHICVAHFGLKRESCLDGRCQQGMTPKSGYFSSYCSTFVAFPFFVFILCSLLHPTPPSPRSPPSESDWRKSLVSFLFLSSLPGSNLSHEWLLQCGHGTSCHMGDLISVRLKHNQLPPKTSQEHNNYCFPLILLLISEVAVRCWGPLLSILVQPTQKPVKREKRLETILPKCSVSEEMIWLLPAARLAGFYL